LPTTNLYVLCAIHRKLELRILKMHTQQFIAYSIGLILTGMR